VRQKAVNRYGRLDQLGSTVCEIRYNRAGCLLIDRSQHWMVETSQ